MYSSDEDDQEQRRSLGIVGLAVTVAIGLVLGLTLWLSTADFAEQGSSAAITEAEAAQVQTEQEQVMDAERVVVENGVVKFYFATGSSTLAAGANEALADVVKGVGEGKKAVVSGFHDSTGNAAINAEIAKERAMAVRHALLALGVAESSIELHKPAVSEGTGNLAQARRVEVVLQ